MSKIHVPMFNIRDITGNFHSFDPSLVATVTTYKVNNSNEWRCEVHVGVEEPEFGRHEQLFLIRQNTQDDAVAIAQRVHDARENALRDIICAASIKLVEVTKGVYVDATTIVYLGKNIHETGNVEDPRLFSLNMTVAFDSNNSRSYSYNFETEAALNDAHARLLLARNGTPLDSGIVNGLMQNYLQSHQKITKN